MLFTDAVLVTDVLRERGRERARGRDRERGGGLKLCLDVATDTVANQSAETFIADVMWFGTAQAKTGRQS